MSLVPDDRMAAPRTATLTPDAPVSTATVAVVGLGYVGLPTSLALLVAGLDVIGIDLSERRIAEIRDMSADLVDRDRRRLRLALRSNAFAMSRQPADIARADCVLICVPTPVDEQRRPDLRALRNACGSVVAHAREGQTIVLTSTTYVGTTRDMLVEPLAARGLIAGRDIHVAFAPERIDPGALGHDTEQTPRVIGGVTPACAEAAVGVLGEIAPSLAVVSSVEAAELTKLYENTFRAVNIALANELAGMARHWGLDTIEVTRAAASKPYGYMAFYPGPGVGGHCIPCDPHYLTHPLRGTGVRTALVDGAMDAIAGRPAEVVARAELELEAEGGALEGARVLVVGAAYKPGVRDVRESPALDIIKLLAGREAQVAYHDPLIPTVDAGPELSLISVAEPDGAAYDVAIIAVCHPDMDLAFLDDCPCVVDCTYGAAAGRRRVTV
jgi:UDP-N-acetyl-D-glucosamine dehydrogenase